VGALYATIPKFVIIIPIRQNVFMPEKVFTLYVVRSDLDYNSLRVVRIAKISITLKFFFRILLFLLRQSITELTKKRRKRMDKTARTIRVSKS
jgi:hypothetical protein